jgi:Fe2+ or Zn2+ uptake regulation protein
MTSSVTLDATLRAVRQRGLRASSARRLVLQALAHAARPVTAEQIAGGLDGSVPASDLGSVYRNLDTLERAGVVRHLRAARGPALYTLARADEAGYVMCERCGEVVAAEREALATVRAVLRLELGYDTAFTRFPIVGVCRACRS